MTPPRMAVVFAGVFALASCHSKRAHESGDAATPAASTSRRAVGLPPVRWARSVASCPDAASLADAGDRPTPELARRSYEQSLARSADSPVRVLSFRGCSTLRDQRATFTFEAELVFDAPGYDVSWDHQGDGWRAFSRQRVLPNLSGDPAAPDVPWSGTYQATLHQKGDRVRHTGELAFERSRSGWRPVGPT